MGIVMYEYYCSNCGKKGRTEKSSFFHCSNCDYIVFPYLEGEKSIYKYYCEKCGHEGIKKDNEKVICELCNSIASLYQKADGFFFSYYCKKCGKINLRNCYQPFSCEFCGEAAYILPLDIRYTPVEISNFQGRQRIHEELIGNSPEIDEELYKKREEQDKKRFQEWFFGRFPKETKYVKPVAVCPYCGSSNVRKITATKKALNSIFWGVFSIGMNMNNFHCDNCESDF